MPSNTMCTLLQCEINLTNVMCIEMQWDPTAICNWCNVASFFTAFTSRSSCPLNKFNFNWKNRQKWADQITHNIHPLGWLSEPQSTKLGTFFNRWPPAMNLEQLDWWTSAERSDNRRCLLKQVGKSPPTGLLVLWMSDKSVLQFLQLDQN